MNPNVVLNGFTSAQLSQMRASKQAFDELLKSLPKQEHPALANRRIVATRSLFEPYVLNIHKFGHLLDQMDPMRIQRNHVQRIGNDEVNYLKALHATHVQYILVVDPTTMMPETGDGNTRSQLYFVENAEIAVPGHVLVLVYFPPTPEIAQDIYDCIDSSLNYKRTRHAITGAMRQADIEVDMLNDAVVANGHLVSAFRRLCKVYSLGSFATKSQSKNREVLGALIKRIKSPLSWLAKYKLGAKELDQGMVGALLWLKELQLNQDRRLNSFFTALRDVADTGVGVDGIDPIVAELWTDVCAHGRGKEKAVDYTFGKTYLAFMRTLKRDSAVAAAAERRSLEEAIKRMPALPLWLQKKLA